METRCETKGCDNPVVILGSSRCAECVRTEQFVARLVEIPIAHLAAAED